MASSRHRRGWTAEEDRLLVELQARLGNKWAQVCNHIPGRNASQCSHRWHHKLNTTAGNDAQVKQALAHSSQVKVFKSRARGQKPAPPPDASPKKLNSRQPATKAAPRAGAAARRRRAAQIHTDASTTCSSVDMTTSSSSPPLLSRQRAAEEPGAEAVSREVVVKGTPTSQQQQQRAGQRPKGVFVCGRRRVYFCTRPRTTTYKQRSLPLLPLQDLSCHNEHLPPEGPQPALITSVLTRHKAAAAGGLSLAFASPPLAASTSHLHSVQTGHHIKRLGPECLDSCKLGAMAAAAWLDGPLGASVGRPRQLQLSRQALALVHIVAGNCSQAEGLGESAAAEASADSPHADAVPSQPGSARILPGEGSSIQGTPRSRMCTPRSGGKPETSSPAPVAATVQGAAGSGRGGSSSRPAAVPALELAAGLRGASEAYVGSPCASQSVSEWSNAPPMSWTSWRNKGYAVAILRADAESGECARGTLPPSSQDRALDDDAPVPGTSTAVDLAGQLGQVSLEHPVHSLSETLPKTQGPAPLPQYGSPVVKQGAVAGTAAGGHTSGRQRRASDPYPAQQSIHSEGSPLKKVCLNSPRQPGLEAAGSSPRPRNTALGRTWTAQRSGYKSLLSILDSAPADPVAASSPSQPSPSSGKRRQQLSGEEDNADDVPGQQKRLASPGAQGKAHVPDLSASRRQQEAGIAKLPSAFVMAGPHNAKPQIGSAHLVASASMPGLLGRLTEAATVRSASMPDTLLNPPPHPPMVPPPLNSAAAQAFRLRRLAYH